MVNVASGIACGRVLSLTTAVAVEVSHQYGDLSRASLVNIRSQKGSYKLNGFGYPCQLTAVKSRNLLTSVTWPHRGLRCRLIGCLLDGGVAQGNNQVNLGQLMHAAYIFAIRNGRSISWSIDGSHNKVSADQYPMTVSRAQVYKSPRSRVF